MSNGVDIPIKVSGGDLAKLTLDQIVQSFTGLEREVIRVAEQSDSTKESFARLQAQFASGAITAAQLREALAAIAAQSSQVSASVMASAPAFATMKTSAAEARALAAATREWSGEATAAGERTKTSATSSAFAFNQIVQAATTARDAVTRLASGVAELASEQSHLDANSSRLGLNFDAAADAAGRFTDETEAMAAATRLAEAGIRLNQQQLDALTQVAARFAQNTGTTTAAALDQLTNGLITGSQRGLRPFGDELQAVAGSSHTAEERLAALTEQASHAGKATDDAASSMARFVDRIDDTKRTLATAFSQGITDALTLAEATQTAGNRFEILNSDIVDAGRTMGTVVVGIGNGIATIVGGIATGIAAMLSATVAGASAAGAVIDRLRSGHVTGLGAAAAAAFRASVADSPITRALMDFTSGRADAANRIAERGLAGDEGSRWGAREQRMADAATAAGAAAAARATSPAVSMEAREGGGRGRDEERKSAKAAQMLADEADRQLKAAQEASAREYLRVLGEQQEAEYRARITARDAYAEEITHANELARIRARLIGLSNEETAANEVRALRARAAQQRAESTITQRAELEDVRDPAVQRERIDEMRRTHALDRERAHLQRRYEMQRTYVDRMEELYDREIIGNEVLATSISAAFRTTGDALTAHLQAFADGEETAAEAAQNMLASTLQNIGKESLAKAGFYFAEGLGNLATLNFPGAATAFAASAAFAAVGGGLVAGGNALVDTNTLGARKDAAAKSESSAREPAARVSRGSASGGGEGTVYNISFGGPMYGTGGVRQSAREIAGVLNRGAVQGGVQLMSGALMGGGAGA